MISFILDLLLNTEAIEILAKSFNRIRGNENLFTAILIQKINKFDEINVYQSVISINNFSTYPFSAHKQKCFREFENFFAAYIFLKSLLYLNQIFPFPQKSDIHEDFNPNIFFISRFLKASFVLSPKS